MISVFDMKPYFEVIPKGVHYEFGVYTGKSISASMQIAKEIGRPFDDIYAFDSFVGLPEEATGLWLNPHWPPGAFNSLEHWQVATIEEAKTKLREKWSEYEYDVKFFVGWYKDVCTKELGEKLKDNRASYVHIDTDIYISCLQCMDWLFEHKLVMNECIFRFDDWDSTPIWIAGESRAMKEVSEKYNLKWRRLAENVFQYDE